VTLLAKKIFKRLKEEIIAAKLPEMRAWRIHRIRE
jgi:hypothetical protein